MKKIASTLLLMTVALTASAYGYGYESSGTSGWLIFISAIFIIAGILQIILFFKIWSMTDDIKAIKKNQIGNANMDEASLAHYIRNNLVLGNRKIVRESLLRNFLNELENERYRRSMTRENDFPIDKDIEKLKKQLDKIGETLPDMLGSCKNYSDFKNIFTTNDLA